jgi:hypothetical protein
MTVLPIENVQDYPRPPALEPVGERLRVVFGGVTIADTTRAHRILETHHAPTYYIPPEDILMSALLPRRRGKPSANGRAGRPISTSCWIRAGRATQPGPIPRLSRAMRS